MSINAKLKELRDKNPHNPYGFTPFERLALFLCRTAFWMALASLVILLAKAAVRLL